MLQLTLPTDTLDLQTRFKQDVEKVAKQRAERKFKPY